MNILEAIENARVHNVVVRRASWPEGKMLFWKNDVLCWNKSLTEADEEPLLAVTVETLLSTDWVEA